jgi:hypothetical protein
MKGIEIKPNTSGKVRTSLCIEDIQVDRMDIMLEFGFISKEVMNEETFWVFKDPVLIPKFNKFYASRIKDSKDPYLEEVIRLLVYLNPMPNALLRKKIVEFIILRFSRIEMRPSQVRIDALVPTPILTFEEVSAALNIYVVMNTGEYKPTTGVYVLFSKDSFYEAHTKRNIHAMARYAKIHAHMSSAIHIVAEYLMDEFEKVKITTSKIESTKLVVSKNGPASIRSITKYMSTATKRDIADHNVGAEFKSYITAVKYEDFLRLPADISLDSMVDKLSISKGRAVEFKKIRNGSE